MFIVSIDKNNVKVAEKEVVTSGSVNAYECQFVFSDDWDEMAKTVTFKAGEKAISVTLDEEGKCVIPWEVLAVADVDLYVGVIGAAGAETEDPADDIVIPTVWGYMGTVRHGTTEGENTELPTPSAYEHIMIEINAIKKDINDINSTFDGGEVGQVWTKTENGEEWADGGAASAPSIGDNGNWYIGETDTGVKAAGTDGDDGFSPTVSVTEIDNGHNVTITDKNGEQSFDVMNGVGTDGFSPTVVITEIENGYNLAVTDKNGTQSVNITNGTDGFSPIVDVTPIEGGHEVTITDASGPHSFAVMNGTGGGGGGGVSPTVDITEIDGGYRLTITDETGSHSADIMNGKDGISPTVSVTEIDNGHNVTITDKNGEQSFDVMDGTDGISPTVTVADIEGGHAVTITDKNGEQSFDVMNGVGTDGFSPTVTVADIEGGHTVTITDKNGDQTFDVINGVGTDGFSPTVTVADIEGGHTVTITDKNGDQTFDVINGVGTDGFSPTVDITAIEGGNKVTITDKNGEQSFDVMNGVGADGKAATVRVGTVTEGDTPAVTNSGTETDAVFDFVLPGASGGGSVYNIVEDTEPESSSALHEYHLTENDIEKGSSIVVPRDYISQKNANFHLTGNIRKYKVGETTRESALNLYYDIFGYKASGFLPSTKIYNFTLEQRGKIYLYVMEDDLPPSGSAYVNVSINKGINLLIDGLSSGFETCYVSKLALLTPYSYTGGKEVYGVKVSDMSTVQVNSILCKVVVVSTGINIVPIGMGEFKSYNLPVGTYVLEIL